MLLHYYYSPTHKQGMHNRVSPDPELVTKNIKQNTFDKYARLVNPTDAICLGHTHPWTNHLGIKMPGVTKEMLDKRSNPPSEGDLKMIEKTKKDYAKYGVDSLFYPQFTYLAADMKGIWYFEGLSDADYKKSEELGSLKKGWSAEALQKFDQAYQSFVLKSIEVKDDAITTLPEYKNLLTSYKVDLGGKVRFVTYKQVSQEPPCAGVDFDATKQPEKHMDVYTPRYTN